MKVIIKGAPEEIATLALAVQERRGAGLSDEVARVLADEISRQTESDRTFQ